MSSEFRTRPGFSHVLTIPDWLGGTKTVRFMFRHRWMLWPLVAWAELCRKYRALLNNLEQP